MSRRPRQGTTLIEIVVAMVILGIAGSGIALMAFHAGRSTIEAGMIAQRNAALASMTERVTNTSYALLPDLAGCTDRADEQFAYLACVRVVQEEENLREVTVLVDPVDESVASASAVVLRAHTPPASPF
jgi:prepilin-type N-terminal cleavage/methylation domain-containing protein